MKFMKEDNGFMKDIYIFMKEDNGQICIKILLLYTHNYNEKFKGCRSMIQNKTHLRSVI